MASRPERETAWPEEPAERVREIVEGVLDELDLDGEVEIGEDDDRIEAVVDGDDDYGLLIGNAARRSTPCSCSATRRRSAACGSASGSSSTPPATASGAARSLDRPADRAAEQALRRQRSVELDPMSAQERRVVHEHLKERAGVETYSEGDEPHRCVVVAPLVSE